MFQAWRVGKEKEDLAVHWFEKNRTARLIKRNYRCNSGEIDLIFEEQTGLNEIELVFVEVRSRAPNSWISALESVTWAKQQKLKSAMRHFLSHYSGVSQGMRLDLLCWDGVEWIHYPHIW